MRYATNWHKSAYILVVSCFCLLCASGHAESVVETAQFTKCMNDVDLGGLKNSQWGACYEAELTRQNRRLEQEYKRLLNEYKNVDKKILDAARKSWFKYREQWCRYQESLPLAPTPYVNYRACLVDTTIEQINKIKRLLP